MAAVALPHPTFTPRADYYASWCPTGRHTIVRDGYQGMRNQSSYCGPRCMRRYWLGFAKNESIIVGGGRTLFTLSTIAPSGLGGT